MCNVYNKAYLNSQRHRGRWPKIRGDECPRMFRGVRKTNVIAIYIFFLFRGTRVKTTVIAQRVRVSKIHGESCLEISGDTVHTPHRATRRARRLRKITPEISQRCARRDRTVSCRRAATLPHYLDRFPNHDTTFSLHTIARQH